jgi:hypothetical protein
MQAQVERCLALAERIKSSVRDSCLDSCVPSDRAIEVVPYQLRANADAASHQYLRNSNNTENSLRALVVGIRSLTLFYVTFIDS